MDNKVDNKMDNKIEQLKKETNDIFDKKINDINTLFDIIRKKIEISKLDKILNELYQISTDSIQCADIDTKNKYITLLTNELNEFDKTKSIDKLINIIENNNNVKTKEIDNKKYTLDDLKIMDHNVFGEIYIIGDKYMYNFHNLYDMINDENILSRELRNGPPFHGCHLTTPYVYYLKIDNENIVVSTVHQVYELYNSHRIKKSK